MAYPVQAEERNFSVIKNYALLSNASYEGESSARDESKRQGYEFSQYGTASGVEVAYFLGTNHKTRTQIIAVRGTANIDNVYVDADFKLMLDKHTSNMLHSGFAASGAAIYKAVKPKLKRDYTINTTGHSLGGAVALVLAMYLEQDEFTVGKVITFGQPKVTNITGAKRYNYMDITRVVTPKDVVPLVPPFDPIDIKNADLYWHTGEELILLEGKEYSTASGIPSMLRTVQFFKETPDERNIQNHFMTLYIELINKKLNDPKKVPYKTGISVYDWF
ncbi:MAG: lipase family protein [Gammaproteobacteria bacterium]|nr:lipase family protein [Gammaproteobacteria bacterium]